MSSSTAPYRYTLCSDLPHTFHSCSNRRVRVVGTLVSNGNSEWTLRATAEDPDSRHPPEATLSASLVQESDPCLSVGSTVQVLGDVTGVDKGRAIVEAHILRDFKGVDLKEYFKVVETMDRKNKA